MNQQAFDQANSAIAKARRSLEHIQHAVERQEVDEAWADFLNAMSRFFEKLKAGARGNSKSWSWYLKQADLRKTDPLLNYLLHARNCDQHRFEDVLQTVVGFSSISVVGEVYVKEIEFGPHGVVRADWTPILPGSQLATYTQPTRWEAINVLDRGVLYEVPKEHLGKPLPDRSVLTFGTLALAHTEATVQEAQSLLR